MAKSTGAAKLHQRRMFVSRWVAEAHRRLPGFASSQGPLKPRAVFDDFYPRKMVPGNNAAGGLSTAECAGAVIAAAYDAAFPRPGPSMIDQGFGESQR